MSKLHHYLSMIVFVSAVMLGVQAPNFVDQYVKRVDAHFQEASSAFASHQKTADLYHDGSVEKLIEHYRAQPDPTFQSGADAIAGSKRRVERFSSEREALQAGLWHQMWHVLWSRDAALFAATMENFSANVPLNADAVICGISAGILASIIFELLLWPFRWVFYQRRKPARSC